MESRRYHRPAWGKVSRLLSILAVALLLAGCEESKPKLASPVLPSKSGSVLPSKSPSPATHYVACDAACKAARKVAGAECSTKCKAARQPKPKHKPIPIIVSADCKRDFVEAAAVDAMHDSNRDLNPTFFSCSSVKEWLLGAKGTPGLGIVTARIYPETRCLYTKAVKSSPVCNDL